MLLALGLGLCCSFYPFLNKAFIAPRLYLSLWDSFVLQDIQQFVRKSSLNSAAESANIKTENTGSFPSSAALRANALDNKSFLFIIYPLNWLCLFFSVDIFPTALCSDSSQDCNIGIHIANLSRVLKSDSSPRNLVCCKIDYGGDTGSFSPSPSRALAVIYPPKWSRVFLKVTLVTVLGAISPTPFYCHESNNHI